MQEGRRSQSKKPTLLPFKKGAFVIALEAGCLPLVPVVFSNFSHIFHFPSKHVDTGTIRVRVLPPVEWDIAEGEAKERAIQRMIERVHESMLQNLQEISV
jgi:1-acyl-sn-glycerol-3-phosphate acyltransferase